jgi:transcriptional regulator with XRE-family HTH domain
MRPGLLDPLRLTLREAREEAGVFQVDVATRAGVHRSVISRFESGRRWPEIGPDRLVAAYAKECGLDWRELWRRALAQLD